MTSAPDLNDELLDLAVRTARAAGRELLTRYGHVKTVETKSTPTDPVSEADRASEQLIVAQLLDARPDDGVLGEEGANQAGTTGLTWIIDPLDGTVNYLYGLDNFAVSIGLSDGEGALVGVVFDPVRDLLYTAIRGRGAFLGNRPLRVNDPVDAAAALLGTGFGYAAERRARQIAVISRLLPAVRDIRRIGSAALDLCAVGAGHLDAFWEEGVNIWDVAAGGLVATEAGAVMSTSGVTGAPTGWLVAGPALHAQLAARLAEVRLD